MVFIVIFAAFMCSCEKDTNQDLIPEQPQVPVEHTYSYKIKVNNFYQIPVRYKVSYVDEDNKVKDKEFNLWGNDPFLVYRFTSSDTVNLLLECRLLTQYDKSTFIEGYIYRDDELICNSSATLQGDNNPWDSFSMYCTSD